MGRVTRPSSGSSRGHGGAPSSRRGGASPKPRGSTVGDAMTMEAAADTLRSWALDEALKARVTADPALARAAAAVSRRYVAGSRLEDVLTVATDRAGRGHAISVELVGESVRDERVARSETDQILTLVGALGTAGLDSTISFDLSHVGAVVSRDLGLSNAT